MFSLFLFLPLLCFGLHPYIMAFTSITDLVPTIRGLTDICPLHSDALFFLLSLRASTSPPWGVPLAVQLFSFLAIFYCPFHQLSHLCPESPLSHIRPWLPPFSPFLTLNSGFLSVTWAFFASEPDHFPWSHPYLWVFSFSTVIFATEFHICNGLSPPPLAFSSLPPGHIEILDSYLPFQTSLCLWTSSFSLTTPSLRT